VNHWGKEQGNQFQKWGLLNGLLKERKMLGFALVEHSAEKSYRKGELGVIKDRFKDSPPFLTDSKRAPNERKRITSRKWWGRDYM